LITTPTRDRVAGREIAMNRTLLLALLCLVAAVSWACSDYDVHGDDDDIGPSDDDDDTDDDDAGDDDVADDDAGDDDVGDDDAGDDDAGDDDESPPETIEECPEDVDYTFYDPDGDGYVAVTSWNDTEDSATLYVDFTGVYHVYDTYIAESGATQTNEHGYITITNSLNPTGEPVYPNCDTYYIVEDSDNAGTPPPGSIYVGTFPLVAGEDNELTIYHYCVLYRAGICTQFHNAGGSDTTCDDNGPNSIHMALDALCLIPL